MHPIRIDADSLNSVGTIAARSLRQAGLVAGGRVAVVGKGGVAMAATVVGAVAMDAIAVPVNGSARLAELTHIFQDAGVVVVVNATDDNADVAAAAATVGAVVIDAADVVQGADVHSAAEADAVLADDAGSCGADVPALLIYTSGTTGRQKGCTHTRATLRGGLLSLMDHWGIGPDDVVINALPLFHVHGLGVALLGPVWAGARVMLLDRFSPQDVVAAVAGGGTVLMCVPTMVHRLVAHLDECPADADVLRRLRLVTCGSAPLPATLMAAFETRTGHVILERYGMSETLITLSNPLHGRRVPGAVGGPIAGVEVHIDDGELLVRGPGVMRGYWGRTDADAEVFVDADALGKSGAPYLRTGDAVSVDDEGVIRIIGRLSQDIMKVGGEKLSTREIEDAIAALDEVADVAVVGRPDVEWGEQVCAAVVFRPGKSLSLAELQARLALAPVKLPRVLWATMSLPRNALGKVVKVELKAAFAGQTMG